MALDIVQCLFLELWHLSVMFNWIFTDLFLFTTIWCRFFDECGVLPLDVSVSVSLASGVFLAPRHCCSGALPHSSIGHTQTVLSPEVMSPQWSVDTSEMINPSSQLCGYLFATSLTYWHDDYFCMVFPIV